MRQPRNRRANGNLLCTVTDSRRRGEWWWCCCWLCRIRDLVFVTSRLQTLVLFPQQFHLLMVATRRAHYHLNAWYSTLAWLGFWKLFLTFFTPILLGKKRWDGRGALEQGCRIVGRVNLTGGNRFGFGRYPTGQNSNFKFKFKKWKIPKKFLKILQVAMNLMVSNFLKNSFI